ncbi:uncharacterized protein VTP21DRAFT_11570 [Calcarisporiella thermophila]|uniref:uncharacterized protein n=1 Tax=Calcarisporiella thermophila TaxID=911321 RepID=UPI0037445836
MTYPTLTTALAFDIPPAGAHIVITDELEAEGNFLLHHFIAQFVKSRKSVVIVGFSQVLVHYDQCLRKMGVNLKEARQSGYVHFVDGLTSLHATQQEGSEPATSSADATLRGSSLKDFYEVIKSYMGNGGLIVIDDLSALLYSGWSVLEVNQWSKALLRMAEKTGGCVVTLTHADDTLAGDMDQEALLNSLLHSADYVLQTRALSSGRSRDVHGQLTLARGPRFCTKRLSGFEGRTLQYKLMDNNVQFFAKGYSSGVL